MIRLEGVEKRFSSRRGTVRALAGVDLTVEGGEFLVIRGPSGSGKSTLLLAAGGMLRPSAGRVIVLGEDLYALHPGARARFRSRNMGFVFQAYHLLPYLTVLENVLLARGEGAPAGRRERARELLERLGLGARIHHRPAELSMGERQRTALARALLERPPLLLADEPTGNLDPENAEAVFQRLAEYHRVGGTVVVVTHGTAADRYAGRIVRLREGRIEGAAAGPAG